MLQAAVKDVDEGGRVPPHPQPRVTRLQARPPDSVQGHAHALEGGVQRGSRGGPEGIYRSSLDARKPQNPINSEEYQGHLQGVLYSTLGAHTSKTRVLPTL